jgi:hypothetical protein
MVKHPGVEIRLQLSMELEPSVPLPKANVRLKNLSRRQPAGNRHANRGIK